MLFPSNIRQQFNPGRTVNTPIKRVLSGPDICTSRASVIAFELSKTRDKSRWN